MDQGLEHANYLFGWKPAGKFWGTAYVACVHPSCVWLACTSSIWMCLKDKLKPSNLRSVFFTQNYNFHPGPLLPPSPYHRLVSPPTQRGTAGSGMRLAVASVLGSEDEDPTEVESVEDAPGQKEAEFQRERVSQLDFYELGTSTVFWLQKLRWNQKHEGFGGFCENCSGGSLWPFLSPTLGP